MSRFCATPAIGSWGTLSKVTADIDFAGIAYPLWQGNLHAKFKLYTVRTAHVWYGRNMHALYKTKGNHQQNQDRLVGF